MLYGTQRDQIASLILNYIGMSPSAATIQGLFGLEPARTVPPGLGPYRLAGWLLDYSLAQPRPDLFIRVVAAVDAQQEALEVHDLVRRLQLDASLWHVQTLDELWIPPQWPFADRQELRQVLMTIADGAGPAAITIEAAEGHGKRTMCTYIEHLADRRGGFRPVVAELRRTPDPGALDALVADLRIMLELDLDGGTTHSDPERHAVVLARNLVRQAIIAPEPVWLVANVIDVAGLEAGMLRFIDELLGQVQATEADLRRLRVVLLSDEVARLGLTNLPELTARHVLPEIGEAAVTEWLAAAMPGKPPQLYSAITSMVFDGVAARQPPPSARLEWLARHCRVAHRRLAGMH